MRDWSIPYTGLFTSLNERPSVQEQNIWSSELKVRVETVVVDGKEVRYDTTEDFSSSEFRFVHYYLGPKSIL